MASRSLGAKLRLIWLAFVDRRTPMTVKLLVIAAILYGVSPLDLLPDFIPLLGQIDDLSILLFAGIAFYKATEKIRASLRKQT